MKGHEEQKPTEGRSKAKKPRFRIEKLEERIAPSHSCHYGRHGRYYKGHCAGGYPPGWYKNGKA